MSTSTPPRFPPAPSGDSSNKLFRLPNCTTTGSCHPCWPPCPASMLNQTHADSGIPNRFYPKPSRSRQGQGESISMGGAFHDGAQILPNFSGTSNSKDVEDLTSNPPLYLGSSGTSSPPGQHIDRDVASLRALWRYAHPRRADGYPDNPNFAWARRPIVFGGGQRNSMR
jgi:hypothetical protein